MVQVQATESVIRSNRMLPVNTRLKSTVNASHRVMLLMIIAFGATLPAMMPSASADMAKGVLPGNSIPPPRWWPLFKRPKQVLLAIRPSNPNEYFTLLTLSGLAAQATQNGKSHDMIWVKQQAPNAYDLWLPAMLHRTGARLVGPLSVSDLVRRMHKAGVISGYIIYHADTGNRPLHQGVPADRSANVATTLCSVFNGIAIADTEVSKYNAMGLTPLWDARTMTEEACFEQFKGKLNRNVVAMQDPKVAEVRDAVVAMNALVICMPDSLCERVFHWANPGTPVLGWGIGDEFRIASTATRYSHFMTDTDWCNNLPLMCTEPVMAPNATSPLVRRNAPSLWNLTWEDNRHYATFIMSDGDNVQWALGDFSQSNEHSWWDSSYRGKMPIGWSCCCDNLDQLAPYTAEYLFRSATPQDDFVLFGGGYFYPDLYATSTAAPHQDLVNHAKDFSAYMRLNNIHLLMFNLEQWDSRRGLSAYETFAQTDPELLGIFGFSYAPYTAGRGATHWVRGGRDGDTPVASVRFAIWNHASDPGQGDPVKIATMLNALPHQGEINSDRYFSTVMIHAWSWFRAPQGTTAAEEVDQALGGSPGTGRGACAAAWCAEKLEAHVKVLRPGEYMWMMRLRIHPEETLQAAVKALYAEVSQNIAISAEKRSAALGYLRAARAALAAHEYALAFDAGKHANRILNGR